MTSTSNVHNPDSIVCIWGEGVIMNEIIRTEFIIETELKLKAWYDGFWSNETSPSIKQISQNF